ncbi:hypothetical protein HYE67_002044 [Fusarium culmorum]|uniref:WSC domain-containing protein n=1 Tax=Fusarium culmorum TaxID=5516 RepID=A0A7S8HSM8_FUSCU|nr:hypothetical protein HYE67_002044 [Fusarium culmorum]
MARLIFVFTALFFWVTLAVAQYDHNNHLKGCYQGRPDDFTLGGFARTQPQRERCALVCSQRGNTFVAFGTVHCFCAKSEPPSTNEVDISRCKAHGLDGWNAPKLGKVNHIEEVFVVFNIDPKRKSNNSESTPQDEAKSSPQSGSPATLVPSAGPSKPLGCYPGLPLDVHLTKITITEDERRECAKSCGEEGKAAVVFSGLRCGCTDILPEASTRVEDIRCALQSTNKLYRTDLVYSVWSTGVEAQEKSTTFIKGPVGKCFSSRPLTSRQFIVRNNGHVREVCLDRCNYHGYPIALVHDSNCWCAKTYPRRIYSSGLESCDIPCLGDDGGRCGGTKGSKLYYSVYETEQVDKAPVDLSRRPFDLPVRHETTWHGCWSKPPITEHHSLSIQNNTPASCASYCRRYNSKVAAVRQNSCVCAESYPERSRRRPDTLCKSTCPGNPYEDCGGTQVWTVVNTGLDTRVSFDKPRLKEQPENFNMNPGSKKASLSGCYAEESVTQGAIQVHIGGGRVELCASRCRNLKMPVSALQGNTCVCRDTIPRKDSKVDKFHCNHSCRDADEGSCGGKDTYSIYNSGLQGHIRIDANTKQSHGCFRFDRFLSTRRTPELVRVDIHGPNRNPKGGSCTTQCAEKGFAVALRHHTQCFCSPGLPQERRRVDDEFCSIECRGDTLETCGGPSYAYTVYKTDAYMPDLHTEKKPKAKKLKQQDLSPSPDIRPQCLHPALDKVNEVFNEVSDRVAAVTQKVQHGFFWVRDKAQHVFDVCLWHVMLFFSNIMYRLGLLSAEGVVEL